MTARVMVCCGVGGVGKTTTAAALALGHALSGLSVVVLTIDPARRLADALALDGLDNEPRPVSLESVGYSGAGSLDAMMLDRRATFDSVVQRFSPDPDRAEKLLGNRYYKAVSERLGGSNEYMAMERLHELVSDGRWDVVVVDTPPTQHALDFFRAPERVSKVFDRSVLKVLVQPGRGLVASTTRRLSQVVRRMVGDNVLEDIGQFFELIGDMSAGFRDRSTAVAELLRSDRTHFFLVAAANAPERTDALAFLDDLQARKLHFAGFLVNRVTPDPGIERALGIADLPGPPKGIDPEAWREALEVVLALARRAQASADRHEQAIRKLSSHARGAPVWTVPELGDAVRTLAGLADMSHHLPPQDPA